MAKDKKSKMIGEMFGGDDESYYADMGKKLYQQIEAQGGKEAAKRMSKGLWTIYPERISKNPEQAKAQYAKLGRAVGGESGFLSARESGNPNDPWYIQGELEQSAKTPREKTMEGLGDLAKNSLVATTPVAGSALGATSKLAGALSAGGKAAASGAAWTAGAGAIGGAGAYAYNKMYGDKDKENDAIPAVPNSPASTGKTALDALAAAGLKLDDPREGKARLMALLQEFNKDGAAQETELSGIASALLGLAAQQATLAQMRAQAIRDGSTNAPAAEFLRQLEGVPGLPMPMESGISNAHVAAAVAKKYGIPWSPPALSGGQGADDASGQE